MKRPWFFRVKIPTNIAIGMAISWIYSELVSIVVPYYAIWHIPWY